MENESPILKEENENTDFKIIKEKIKDKITKDKQRVQLRSQNMNKYKKYDMMDFEKTRFEIIQKSSKKFAKITEENKNELLEDVEKLNFQKVLEEIIKSIVDSKFDFKDVNAIIIILSELNQIYDKFDAKYLEYMKKHFLDFNESFKTPTRSEEEEERRNQRRKVLLRLFIESYLYGFFNDFNLIRDIFVSLISPKNPKEQFQQDFPILVNLMRIFGEPLFGIKSKNVKSLIEKNEIENYDLNIIVPKVQVDKYYNGFKDYYYKVVLIYLEEEHKILIELEKKNFENMKRLDSNNEINTAYIKQRAFYLKFIGMINEFAEIMDFEIPELANEKTFRYEEQKKNEMKLEKINKYDPFSDEAEYLFYTQPLNIKEKISAEMMEKIINRKKDELNEGEDLLDTNEKKKKFDNLLSKILKCDSTESIDEATIEFFNNPVFLVYRYRKLIFKSLLRSSKTNLAVLKYFARFNANVSTIYKDIPTETSNMLIEDFHDLNKEEKLGMFDEKIKNVRFISEMVKFELFPMNVVFEILKKLIEDFKGHSIDVLCQLMETCGRFLYLNEMSHLKFHSCLDTLKQYAHHKIRHDERAFNSILNCIGICRPQESTLRKQVKIRPIEEEYIRFLIFHSLNKDTIRRTAVLLRRFDWDNWEHVILKVIYKYLNRGNENQIKYCCALLFLLKDHHPSLIFNLINTVLEEIRIGLDRNDFNDNQHRILMVLLCSHFYSYKLINSDLIFYILYMIITYNPEWSSGRRELITDNQLDLPSDTFRMQMVITILDICGQHLNTGSKKERLNEFLHFLQIYILSKQYLPLDVENRITTCLENLYDSHNYHVYTDFTEALKDAKKYKGLNFEIDDKELISADKKSELKFDPNDFNRSNFFNHIYFSDINQTSLSGDSDFKRKKEGTGQASNIDEEIQKIISESLVKAKGSSRTNNVINPLSDIKKKDLNKMKENSNKIKLITKQPNTNKIIIKELDKNIFLSDKDKEKEDIEAYEDDEEEDN